MEDPKKDIAIPSITQDIITLIATAKSSALSYVNSSLTLLYWQIGKRLLSAGLRDNAAKYGDRAVENISTFLVNEYGQGFNYSSLHRMMRFAELIPDQDIVATLSQDLSWSHFVILITLRESLARDFYIEMCRTHVAEYLTDLPPKDLLVAKLDRTIKEARAKYNVLLIEDN